jgi:DNA polymerase-3 subunit beta
MGTKTKRSSGIALNAADLKTALATVRDAVQERSPKPILRNVLISGGQMTATDLELQVTTAIGFDGPALLLPHGRTAAILNECRGDEVTIAPGDTSCVIACGRGSWTLPTEDAAEFPHMSADGATNRIKLPADQFARAIRSVVYACDRESSRYALGGVMIEVQGETVSFVATDGRRLTLARIDHDLAVDDSETLVPQRVAKLLARIAEQAGGEELVEIDASGNTVVCTIGTTVVTARLVEGKFPRWRDVFPKRDVRATVVNRDALAAATRAAAITTSEQSKGVDYSIVENGIHLHAQSSEAGESSVTCEIVEPGETVTVKLDPRFVTDFLAGLPSDSEPNVEIEAVAPGDAVQLRNGDVFGIIMPLAND